MEMVSQQNEQATQPEQMKKRKRILFLFFLERICSGCYWISTNMMQYIFEIDFMAWLALFKHFFSSSLFLNLFAILIFIQKLFETYNANSFFPFYTFLFWTHIHRTFQFHSVKSYLLYSNQMQKQKKNYFFAQRIDISSIFFSHFIVNIYIFYVNFFLWLLKSCCFFSLTVITIFEYNRFLSICL